MREVRQFDADKLLVIASESVIETLLGDESSNVAEFESFWEKLLMPAYIFFFKFLYPFSLSNSTNSKIAAAAGGCILLETKILNEIGGFGSIKNALIDDCTLAKKVKPEWIQNMDWID